MMEHMWKNINFERCLAYINSQTASESKASPAVKPVITVSRMCGAGGRTVVSKLAEYLQSRLLSPLPWTIFDRNLMEQVLEDHHLSKRLAQYLPEAHQSKLEDSLEGLLGVHPPMATVERQISETILSLAARGCVILVGRGANVVTAGLPQAFHVRLVGSVKKRLDRLMSVYDFDFPAAQEFLKAQDTGKKRYLKEHFKKDIDDPLLYHLIINTDVISYESAARLIGDTVIHWFGLEETAKPAPKEMV